MNKLLYLDLPTLPTDLEEELVKIALQIPTDESGRQWIEEFHEHKVRATSHVYGRGNTIISNALLQEIRKIYSPFFDEDVNAIVGNFTNTYGDGLTESPPHCDRYRHVSINYLLQTGGSNVRTCFFNESRKNDDLSMAENCRHDELTRDFDICLPKNVWHSYNVQNYHSVENIETTRLMFSLILPSNPDLPTFENKFKNLIK
jgi:hypothetical protein